MWAIKCAIIVILILIFIQDFKDRMVYWYYYAAVGIFAFVLQADAIGLIPTLINAAANLIFTGVLVGGVYAYSKFRMQVQFVNGVIGAGDLLCFIALASTFSIISFIIIFVFSLIFSLVLHLYLKKKSADQTVPLAGYMSLFFAAVYVVTFIPGTGQLYAY